MTVDNQEIQGHMWVEPSEALKMNIDSFVRRSVEELLRKRGEGPKKKKRAADSE